MTSRSRDAGAAWLAWSLASLGLASILVAIAITFASAFNLTVDNSVPLQGLIVSFLFALCASLTFAIFWLMRRVRDIQFRVAITGRPKAGKTVFANLIFDALMNERVSDARFTASTRSMLAVYQAIRNIPDGVWPKATDVGSVSLYEGTLEARRARIDIEIGDSAGEYWLELPDEADRDVGYLEYVLSANAIVHVIPIRELLAETAEAYVKSEIDDLRLAARLKRSVGKLSSGPLLIVISKVDEVIPSDVLEASDFGLLSVNGGASAFDSLRIVNAIQHTTGTLSFSMYLEVMESNLKSEFDSVRFVFSSAPAVAFGRMRELIHGGSLVQWVISEARAQNRRG